MKKTIFARSMMAVVLGSVLLSGTTMADTTSLMDKAQGAVDSAGSKIDSSVKKVDNYMSDSAITTKVKAALSQDKDIKSGLIHVTTRKGVVKLDGSVTTKEQSDKAIELAKGVDGVKDVHNNLKVKGDKLQDSKNKANDKVINTKAKTTLLTGIGSESRNIHVNTKGGVAHLTGTVTSKDVSERAESLVKSIDGVTSVQNSLTVK